MGGVKTMSGALGFLMVILGGIWILQGLNVSFAPQSFMTADINWTYRGVAFAIVGLILLVRGLSGAGAWKNVLGALGTLCAVVGFLWLLQAVSVHAGAGVTYNADWAVRGGIAFVVGVVLIFIGARGQSAA